MTAQRFAVGRSWRAAEHDCPKSSKAGKDWYLIFIVMTDVGDSNNTALRLQDSCLVWRLGLDSFGTTLMVLQACADTKVIWLATKR